ATVLRTREVEIETTTGDDGRFRIELPENSTLLGVYADGDDVVGDAHWTIWTNSGPVPEPLILTRYRRGVLEGHVTEPSGVAVAGARVSLTHRENGQPVTIDTLADEHGHFVFASTTIGSSWLSAEREGFLQVGRSRPRPRPRGGWHPARLLLAPTGTLTIETEDATGHALDRAIPLAVATTAAETGLFAAMDCRPDFVIARAVIEQGRASLRVPAGLRLQFAAGETVFDRQRQGHAVAHEDASRSGVPIVVGRGEEQMLRLALGMIVVNGVVLDPEGDPVAGVDLWFDLLRAGRIERLLLTETDSSGEFVQHFTAVGNETSLMITAQSAGLRASRLWPLDGSAPAVAELRLAPVRDLTGHVRDAVGRPIEARILHAFIPPGQDAWIINGHRSTDADGGFSLHGMTGVRQRIEVRVDGLAPILRDDVDPDEPIEVVIEPPQRTRVRLLLSGASAAVDELEVRVDHLEAASGTEPAWPVLTASTPWSNAAPHPMQSHPVNRRVAGPEGIWRGEVSRFPHLRDEPDGKVVELYLCRGPAAITVSGREANGPLLSHVSTGTVTIAGEALELPIALAPVFGRRGRIHIEAGGERFDACVALADDAGRLQMISVMGNEEVWETILAASSHGHFTISGIPAGTWELRVGTRTELENGGARLRQRVLFAADQTEPLTLRL
ncbi:MAG: carboxypeptidase regulatory-like domain-containing protein, partial [Planctomycetes bacterium]|nr:carboxypeptidase regulatory-like domain-containing protein [Planctomycetota bacterium]